MDDISRYALVTARRETLRISTSIMCRERWESSRVIPGYSPPPQPLLRKDNRRMYLRNKKGSPHLNRFQLDRLHPHQRLETGELLPANYRWTIYRLRRNRALEGS